jgi:excisionase family DNA binding protein
VDELSEVMTEGEVAAYLKVHPTTVYRLLKRKGLPGFKVGSEFRLRRVVIDEWIMKKNNYVETVSS